MKKLFPESSISSLSRIAVLASILIVLTFSNSSAQCSVAGTGTVTGNVNFGSSNNWANPNRATLSDDLYARVQLASGEVSKYLSVSDYGFIIPPGATIDGIEVKIEGHQEDFLANFADASIVLTQYGTIVGADRAGTGYYDDKDYVNVYGSATDLWGATWTPADVMDPGFGVMYSVTRLSGTGTYYMYVDYVEVTVYYSGTGCILPVTYTAYNVVLEANKSVKINWATASETNVSHYNIEKSTDGMSFNTIGSTFAAGNASGWSDYSYADPQHLEGTAFYRLQSVDLDGQSQYSEVKSVTASGQGELTFSAYPNPAHDKLQLSGAIGEGRATIMDAAGRMVLQQAVTNETLIDVSKLGHGLYVLQVSNESGVSSQRVVIE